MHPGALVYVVAVYLALQDREQIRNDHNSNRHERQIHGHNNARP